MSTPEAVSNFAPRPERKGELIAMGMENMAGEVLADLDVSEAEVDHEYAALKSYFKNLREQIVARKAEAIANAKAFSTWCNTKHSIVKQAMEPVAYPHGDAAMPVTQQAPEVTPPEPIEEPDPAYEPPTRPYIRRIVASPDDMPALSFLTHKREPHQPALARRQLLTSAASTRQSVSPLSWVKNLMLM